MAQTHIPVLIVGAGGAGLSLSLLLHQQGIASMLIERRSEVSWYPRARNLNFRTLEVFRELGLEPQVLAAGAHFSRTLRKETLASREEEDLPSIEAFLHIADHLDIVTPEPALWYCPQSRLEPLLLAEAKRCGGARKRLFHPVQPEISLHQLIFSQRVIHGEDATRKLDP